MLATAVSGLLTLTTPALADAFDGPRTRIEEAYRSRDVAGIEAARAELLVVAAGSGRPGVAGREALAADAAYYAAYARFRQALAVETNGPAASAYLEDCISELRVVVAERPAHAEARALLGSCYGMSTLYDVLATMTRGLEARHQMSEARRLAPDNPWVVLQDGLADWATPRLFGGNRQKAVAKLERAAGLFSVAMDRGSRLAAWGAAEAWHQLGLRYRALGRTSDAEVAFDRARLATTARLQVATNR